MGNLKATFFFLVFPSDLEVSRVLGTLRLILQGGDCNAWHWVIPHVEITNCTLDFEEWYNVCCFIGFRLRSMVTCVFITAHNFWFLAIKFQLVLKWLISVWNSSPCHCCCLIFLDGRLWGTYSQDELISTKLLKGAVKHSHVHLRHSGQRPTPETDRTRLRWWFQHWIFSVLDHKSMACSCTQFIMLHISICFVSCFGFTFLSVLFAVLFWLCTKVTSWLVWCFFFITNQKKKTSVKMCLILCYTFLFGFWTQHGDEFFYVSCAGRSLYVNFLIIWLW